MGYSGRSSGEETSATHWSDECGSDVVCVGLLQELLVRSGSEVHVGCGEYSECVPHCAHGGLG